MRRGTPYIKPWIILPLDCGISLVERIENAFEDIDALVAERKGASNKPV